MIVHAEQANASSVGKYDKLPFNSNAAGVMMDEMYILSRVFDAIGARNPDALRDALARGADVNNGHLGISGDAGNPISLLEYAAMRDDLPPHACCSLLLAAGADVHHVDGRGATALCLAARVGRPTLVALFLAAGADPNNRGEFPRCEPLSTAIYSGSRECALMLLRAGANLTTFSPKWIREKLREARRGSDKEQHLNRVRSLNNFLRLMRDNGGWEAHVKRHRALLVGRLRYWLRLPEDALGIVVDFSVLPGGS